MNETIGRKRTFSQRSRTGFICLLLFLAVAPAYAAQITIHLDGQSIVTESLPRVSSSGTGSAQFDLSSGQFILSVTGQPALPYQTCHLMLPPDVKLDTVASQLRADYVPLEGRWSVAPVPPMATRDEDGHEIIIWPSNRTIVDGYDVDLYATDAFWPAVQSEVISTGKLRNWRMAEIAIPLFRYNPVTGQLLELAEAELVITSDKEKVGTGKALKKEHQKNKERVRELAVNFNQAAAAYETEAESSEIEIQASADGEVAPASPTLTDTGYVILTTNAIRNASTKLANFVAHKQALGYTVNIITESQYGSGSGDTAAANIRTWLKNNYTNTAYGSGGILYVLLIGDPRMDSSSVPMKECIRQVDPVTGQVTGNIPTDYFYAELTSDWDANGNGIYGEHGEVEKYFEVYVGRIPYYGTISETDSILQKIMTYENQTDTGWRRNALLPMVPLDGSTPAYQLGEEIKYNLLEPKGIPSTRIYEQTYGLNPAPEYLLANCHPGNDVWAKGIYGMVIWNTHGNVDFASGIIATGDTPNLNNNYPSAVYQGSCLNGHPETTTNLGYAILKNGGIGTVAASRSGYYWVGQ